VFLSFLRRKDMHRNIKISEVADALGFGSVNKDVVIQGLNLCDRKTNYDSILTYATSEKYIETVQNNSSVKAILVKEESVEKWRNEIDKNILVIGSCNPEKLFYQIHEFLCVRTDFYSDFEFETMIGNGSEIAESAVIENGVIIGENVKIGANTVVRKGSRIDSNVTIGCNTIIGSEGFQLLVMPGEEPIHATHVGGVHICKDVYIGDNTCVCNCLFEGETYIGQGAKIDNLVHVAHNLYIGENAVVTAHVILCGSSIVEDNAWIAPNASVLNKVIIGKGAKVGLGSVVTRNVEPGTTVYGSPARVH